MCLETYRLEIDEIDDLLVKTFERRMEISLEIASYKINNSLPIYDEKRESKVLKKNLLKLKNKEFQNELRHFLIAVMELSKQIQKRHFEKNDKKEAEYE